MDEIEKIKILERVKQKIIVEWHRGTGIGICIAIANLGYSDFISPTYLGIKRPMNKNKYWWPLNGKGFDARIKAIDKAIARHRFKLKLRQFFWFI